MLRSFDEADGCSLTASQNIGDFDQAGDGDDTTNDDGVNIVTGSFRSIGPLLGNLSNNPPGT